MIDTANETLLTLKAARQEFPTRPSIATLWRWVLKGTKGVTLESVLIGGRRFTSKEAILRFIEATSEQAPIRRESRQRTKRERSISRAKAVLDQFGV